MCLKKIVHDFEHDGIQEKGEREEEERSKCYNYIFIEKLKISHLKHRKTSMKIDVLTGKSKSKSREEEQRAGENSSAP